MRRTAPDPGKWLLLLYWDDLSRPEGLAVLGQHRFELGAELQVVGVTTLRAPVEAAPFPVLRDSRRRLADALGLVPVPGLRASYLMDPHAVIRWSVLEALPTPRPLEAAMRALWAVPLPKAPRVERRLECMCAWCRKVQEDGRWQTVEHFIEARLPVEFTHGICPACLEEHSRQARPPHRGRDGRRSERVLLRIPVLLDAPGGAQPAETVEVSRHGGLVLSPVAHPAGAALVIKSLETGESARCRVAWCGGAVAPGLYRLGLELVEERPGFWGPEYETKRASALVLQ